MDTYYFEYKKYTGSEWLTYTTTAPSNAEAYDNFYRDLGSVYAIRLKYMRQDDTENNGQDDPIPPIVFIILFIILMHFVFR